MFTHATPLGFRPAWLARAANAVLIGTIQPEERHPISRALIRLYEPVCAWALRWKWVVIAAAVALTVGTIPVYQRLGSEFMPPLDEGTLLYMPSTLPGLSVTQAQRILQVQGQLIRQFPEVERVFGKAGRAETSTDPAPFSMMETVIMLKPHDRWRRVPTWYSAWAPSWLVPVLSRVSSDRISTAQLIADLNDTVRIPGVTNAWTMPIKARIDMLTTGVRTPVGIKVHGADIREIERIGTADRGGAARGPRHAQRVRGTDVRWLLRRLRLEAGRTGAVRPVHRRRADGRDVGRRRRHRDDDGRRAGSGTR